MTDGHYRLLDRICRELALERGYNGVSIENVLNPWLPDALLRYGYLRPNPRRPRVARFVLVLAKEPQMSDTLQVKFNLDREKIKRLVRYAITRGWLREEPRKAWTYTEERTAARWAISDIIERFE